MSTNHENSIPPSSSKLRMVSNERGSILALVALLLIVFLGLAALAIDLGLLYVARGEAQRAADSAAHAGAGHLQIVSGDEEGARDAAVKFASRNVIRGEPVEIDRDQDVEVFLDGEQRVRVTVRRTSEWGGPVGTIFGRVLGFSSVDVAAVAAAQVWSVDQSDCMLPVAIPDRWCEEGNEGACVRWPDQEDSFDPDGDGDFYVEWERGMEAGEYTGYSIDDIGEYIYLRPEAEGGGQGQGQGSGGARWDPNWWAPFHASWLGYGGQDVPSLAAEITGCSDVPLGIGSEVETWNGNAAEPLRGAWEDLIAQDDSASWNFDLDCVVNKNLSSPTKEDCRDSPRKRPIALFDPYEGPQGPGTFTLTRLAAIFVDDVVGGGSNLQVRTVFAGFSGNIPGDSGAGSGDFVTMLRIVE